MRRSRHVLDAKNQAFLDTVIETSEKRRRRIEAGSRLWRAQLGSVDERNPFLPERMSPLADRANEGRVNPKGIPCFYCSTDRETAMTETRPWMGSLVSVAQFVVLRDLTVVDCSADPDAEPPYSAVLKGIQPDPRQRERHVWAAINKAFSEPVTRSDDVAEYAATQMLSDAFRFRYDGIVYASKLGSGQNVAIFSLAAAEIANCHLYRVKAVRLEFEDSAHSYNTEKYGNDSHCSQRAIISNP
jgi:hypothetical protein